MAEDIVRMGPMLILAGLMAGWLAEAVSRRGGYGFTRDLGLGLAGSVIGGAAALLILAQRAFWRSARTAPRGALDRSDDRHTVKETLS